MKSIFQILCVVLFCLYGQNVSAQYDDDNYYDTPAPKKDRNSDRDVRGNDSDRIPGPADEKEEDKKGFDKSKMAIGGFLGASFGDVFYVDISPVVTYRPIDRTQFGVGFIYQYTYWRALRGQYPEDLLKSSVYGARVFDRVFVWDELFVQVEYLMFNGEVTYQDLNTGDIAEVRRTFHTVFAGGGYNVPMGRNSFLSLQMLINLNTNLAYQRRQPFFNIGFGIGL